MGYKLALKSLKSFFDKWKNQMTTMKLCNSTHIQCPEKADIKNG